MKPHVMLDIETMGNGNEAAIIAIGATKFNPLEHRQVLDSFYAPVMLESSVHMGLKMDASTVLWWMHEDRAAARKQLLDETPIDLVSALEGFAMWFGPTSLPTWGNGATFDNVIVRNAMKKCGIPCPWQFWDDRCFRTLKNQYVLPAEAIEECKPEGVAHHALYDAVFQTHWTQAINHAYRAKAVAA